MVVEAWHGTCSQFDEFEVPEWDLGLHFALSREVALTRISDIRWERPGTPTLCRVQVECRRPWDRMADMGDWQSSTLFRTALFSMGEGPFESISAMSATRQMAVSRSAKRLLLGLGFGREEVLGLGRTFRDLDREDLTPGLNQEIRRRLSSHGIDCIPYLNEWEVPVGFPDRSERNLCLLIPNPSQVRILERIQVPS